MPSFDANLIPSQTGIDLGSSTALFDLFAQQINWGDGTNATDILLERSAANTLRLATGDSFIPQSTGQDLGSSSNRWDVFAQIAHTPDSWRAGDNVTDATSNSNFRRIWADENQDGSAFLNHIRSLSRGP